jgi:voltage-gated potassium channel
MEPSKHKRKKLQRAAIFETAMAVLGFLWMSLLILELAYGLTPLLTALFNIIWAVFILDFSVRFWRADGKRRYIKKNWLVGLSLIIPAMRIFRIFQVIRVLRAARVIRGIRLARLFTSFRRSARALRATMSRRGFEYVAGVTVIVIFAGGAGMYAFEHNASMQQGFNSYGESVWWTAMIITTLGSQDWPVTTEGRILCLVLSIYAITILGYVAASLASYFIDRDATQTVHPKDVRNLQEAVNQLHRELKRCAGPLEKMQQARTPGPDEEPS